MTLTPEKIYLKDYKKPDFLLKDVRLAFDLDPKKTIVQLSFLAEQNPDASGSEYLELAGKGLTLLEVRINDKVVEAKKYELSETGLRLHLPYANSRISIKNEIAPEKNTALEGLYVSKGIFCTQCEPEGFRCITYFPDRPDILCEYDVYIEAEKARYPVLLSNGNCYAKGDLENGRHFARWRDPFKKPSYLFALVAGNLSSLVDYFHTKSGRVIELAIFAASKDIERCHFAMASLKNAMKWDEDIFDLEFDLDQFKIVSIDDFNMGAMENKGLNIFNNSLILALPETATDGAYDRIENVIGHEYFHNWTGNRITLRDWFQLCLKEGLTVYRDQEFAADMTSRAVARITDVNALRQGQWPEDDGPMAHPPRPDQYIEINNFYTHTVYQKGAEVVRMLCTLIGRENFHKGFRLYVDRFDGKAATQEDFVQAMADASQTDLSQFMLWYTQAGTPKVVVTENYDEKAQTYSLHFEQSTKSENGKKSPFAIPIKLSLFNQDGTKAKLILLDEAENAKNAPTERTLVFNKANQSFKFAKIKGPVVPSLFRDFSAAVRWEFSTPRPEHLQFLSLNDDDAFNRFDALEREKMDYLLAAIFAKQKNEKIKNADKIAQSMGKLLAADIDLQYKGYCLQLPSEAMLAQSLQVIDPEAIYDVLNATHRYLAKAHESRFYDVHSDCFESRFMRSQESKGKRRMRGSALSYLSWLDDKKAHDFVYSAFQKANNMTELSTALSCLIAMDNENLGEALDSFYDRYHEDALSIDLWFSLQAGKRGPDGFSRVKNLLMHKDFKIENPNRVRSLLMRFFVGNQSGFHFAKDEAYQLCADYVLKLDKINQQMASHLVRAFEQWRRMDDFRRNAMQAQLMRIKSTAGLSPDVFEVTSRLLGGA